ncbi:MAG: FUSC family protein [Leucobacter sp.]
MWPGAIGVALFGVLAASFSWISGGPKVGVAVVVSLAILGVIAIMLEGHTWALATMLLLLGIGYGFAASRGVGSAVLQLPILVPYFMMSPPGLFSTDDPKITPQYVLCVVAVIIGAGLWSVLVLHKAAGIRHVKRLEVTDPRMPLLYGTILGIFSAIIMILATTCIFHSHWVWVTLTIYVLADPTELVNWKKMSGRVLGTLAGFGVVTVLALVGTPDEVMLILALPALWFCLYWMVTKKPYWQYIMFLTLTVVLMNSYGVNTLLMDGQRIGFTIVGAALSVLAAFLINLLHYHRRGITRPAAS